MSFVYDLASTIPNPQKSASYWQNTDFLPCAHILFESANMSIAYHFVVLISLSRRITW